MIKLWYKNHSSLGRSFLVVFGLLDILDSLLLSSIHFFPLLIREATGTSGAFVVPQDVAARDTDRITIPPLLWHGLLGGLVALLGGTVSIPFDALLFQSLSRSRLCLLTSVLALIDIFGQLVKAL